ncbi:cyclopropane-fatty-acyl-phospholipid synthase family protein [Nocardioides sp. GXZ039]|uniref:cyclopropane-fatty-acyl-phospholipid synthase family protein n=1 Tax=Nocardioides sp. GXZ039 TaxID=3136018 RepID=UPI0030F381ED
MTACAQRLDTFPATDRGEARGPRVALARRVVRAALERVPVRVRMPDGSWWTRHQDDSLPAIEMIRPDALFARIAASPKIGIGEGYMAGDWQVDAGTDLAAALLPFAERMSSAVPPALLRLRGLVDRPIPLRHRNSPEGSRRNIEAHYDLSNDLFETFLDDSLSYSSALFDDATGWASQDLVSAQERKVDAILDLARVGPGSSVLEIGTGWGTLAIRAAMRGARVLTITLSHEQAALARRRIREAGLDASVEVRIADYREVRGTYDAVVSVEMIEAVGEEFWPAYFGSLDRMLAPGGTVAIQAILMEHDRYRATRRSYGWIQKHIFPGGLIPSLRAIEEVAASATTLQADHVHRFGLHYAETLRRWREAFVAAADRVDALGFDETFRRKWEFYLAYCEAGFAAGYLDVAQIRLTRPTDEVPA